MLRRLRRIWLWYLWTNREPEDIERSKRLHAELFGEDAMHDGWMFD